MKYLIQAFFFLTIFPFIPGAAPKPGDLGRAAGWYPWVGLVMGGLLAGVSYLLNMLFAPLLSAALVVALWVVITGGLHLDGLADCCDGMLNSSPPARRLEIMRDSRLGAFGGIGLVLYLLVKVAAVASLPPGMVVPALLAAPVVGRWLVLLAAHQPMVRPGGLGDDFKLGFTTHSYLLAAAPLILLGIVAGWTMLAAVVLAHLAALGVFALARATLGGLTGDVFGLTIELGELAVLIVFAAVLPGMV
jgi:adenosylcobinamide-GDP ribazoletransferase